MSFYKAGKELADLHLNYEQNINEPAIGQDGNYLFFAAMPMSAHRTCGIEVNGDMDIWKMTGRMKPTNTLPLIK